MIFGAVLVGSPGTVARAERGQPIEAYYRRQATADALPGLRRALPALLDVDCLPNFTQDPELFLDAAEVA